MHECFGKPEEDHGHAEPRHAGQQDRLAPDVVRDARPLENEHGFCEEENGLLYVRIHATHENDIAPRRAKALTIIPA